MGIPKLNMSAGPIRGPGILAPESASTSLTEEEIQRRNVLAGRNPNQPAIDRFTDSRYQTTIDARKLHKAFELNLTTASDIKEQETDWIFPGYLAKGELTLLAGPPNVGKTTIACYLAAAMTVEDKAPLNEEIKAISPGNVVYISVEDSEKKSVKPRLMAAGANLDHVHVLDVLSGKNGGKPFSFSNDEDIERLVQLNFNFEGTLDLIIIDPIYFAVDGDFTSNSKARKAYERLRSIAQLLNCAVLGIAHTVKSPKGKGALERITSPSALREIPRIILVAAEIAEKPTEGGGNYVLICAKNNLGRTGGGLEYDILETEISNSVVKSNTLFKVTKVLSGSAEDILVNAEKSKRNATPRKIDIAKSLLLEKLQNGDVIPGKELIELANSNGISENTLKAAKKELRVQSRKRQGDGISEWFINNQSME
jgi:putative DNA primase/helicase